MEDLQAAGSTGGSAESAAELALLRDEVPAAVARAEEADARAKTLAQEKESFGKRWALLRSRHMPFAAQMWLSCGQLSSDALCRGNLGFF